MLFFSKIIHSILPLIALGLLIIGLRKNAIYYIISALWLSLIALIIHYQASGGEILGGYFNYFNAFLYTLDLFILCLALSRVIYHLSGDNSFFRYLNIMIQLFIVVGSCLLIVNLWINADFIEHRMKDTPVMQVTLPEKPDYCSYRYIFYTITSEGNVAYLCPNYYGLIPSFGSLAVGPDFMAAQFPMAIHPKSINE